MHKKIIVNHFIKGCTMVYTKRVNRTWTIMRLSEFLGWTHTGNQLFSCSWLELHTCRWVELHYTCLTTLQMPQGCRNEVSSFFIYFLITVYTRNAITELRSFRTLRINFAIIPTQEKNLLLLLAAWGWLPEVM